MLPDSHPSKTFNLEKTDKQDYPLSFEKTKRKLGKEKSSADLKFYKRFGQHCEGPQTDYHFTIFIIIYFFYFLKNQTYFEMKNLTGSISLGLISIILSLVIFTFLNGCKNTDDSNPVVPPASDVLPRTTITHASPNSPNVDIIIGDSVYARNVPYLTSLSYIQLNTGNNRIRMNNTGSSTSLIDVSYSFEANKNYSVFSVDSLIDISPLRIEDALFTPAAGLTNVRFAHLSPNTGEADVFYTGGTLLFPAVEYKEASGFETFASGTYNLQVRVPLSTTVLLNIPNITFESRKIYTLYLRGFFGASGTQAFGYRLMPNN